MESDLQERNKIRITKQLEKLNQLPSYLHTQSKPHLYNNFKIQLIVNIAQLAKESLYAQLIGFGVNQYIFFQVLLNKDYPFSAPQICLKTELSKPRLNDRRNLLVNILEKQWGPAILLVNILQKIPKFLVKLRQNITSYQYIHNLGEFNELQPYFASDLSDSNIQSFECLENNQLLTFKARRQILLGVSDSYIIFFQHNKSNKDELKILDIKFLNQLSGYGISKRNTYKITYNSAEYEPRVFTVVNNKHQQITDAIRKRLEQFTSTGNHGLILQLEESHLKFTASYQDKLQFKIKELQKLSIKKPSKQHLKELIELYSEAIQGYSLSNQSKQNQYQKRLKKLLKDPDYQKLLF